MQVKEKLDRDRCKGVEECLDGKSDAEVVRFFRNSGATWIFGVLLVRHRSNLEIIARSILGQWSDAEDMVQEAYLRAYTNIDLLADESRFGAWIKRILFGCCIDFLRRRARIESVPIENLITRIPDDREPGSVGRIASREFADEILAAIDKLPERYCRPLKLFHLDGLSHAEVAHYLGVPEGTVRSMVSRARRRLRSILVAAMADGHEAEAMDEGIFRARSANRGLVASLSERTLHIANGDATAGLLREAGVPGKVAVWADVLHEGPVDPALARGVGIEKRAQHIEEMGIASAESAMKTMSQWHRDLRSYRQYEEVILWFEHDLYDQLALLHHLAYFATEKMGKCHLSLICVGAYPGKKRFRGLGQLTPNQLVSLLGTRCRVTRALLGLGLAAWEAFGASEPGPWLNLLGADTSALPFLAGAVRRHLQQYPSTRNGLGMSEQLALEVVASGATTAGEAFRDHQEGEARVFLGDATFYHYLRRLSSEPHPLLAVAEPDDGSYYGKARLELKEDGQAVLEGRANAVALRGFDRWFGGVRVRGKKGIWRWDEARGTLLRV